MVLLGIIVSLPKGRGLACSTLSGLRSPVVCWSQAPRKYHSFALVWKIVNNWDSGQIYVASGEQVLSVFGTLGVAFADEVPGAQQRLKLQLSRLYGKARTNGVAMPRKGQKKGKMPACVGNREQMGFWTLLCRFRRAEA